MSRVLMFSLLRRFLLSTTISCVFLTGLQGQSRQAYLNAARTCLEKGDAFGAKAYLLQALEYEASAEVFLALSETELKLFNHKQAFETSERAAEFTKAGRGNALTDDENWRLLQVRVEVRKRLGLHGQADSLLLIARNSFTARSAELKELQFGLKQSAAAVKDTLPIELIPLNGDVNTAHSDFAPAFIGDSTLLYSSLRYTTGQETNPLPTSRIASVDFPPAEGKRRASSLLSASINQPAFNTANASVSPDGKWMVFSRCLDDENGKLRCALYMSTRTGNSWSEGIKLDKNINAEGRTSTQPCITSDGAEGYVLFFSSDRSGGKGGMDIYRARMNQGKFQVSEAVSNGINSVYDEWTPFYDATTDTLYFSSERPGGLGGLDLYACSMTEKAEQVNPLPPPLNSAYNDLYYCTSYGESHHTLLVSNRPPAQSLNGTACCYDIFRVVPSKEAALTVSDSTQKSDHEHPLTSASDSTGIQMSEAEFLKLSAEQQVQFMNTRFPIRLYFDNDYPDPRSRKPTTESMVDSLCREYIGRKAAYLSAQFNADDQVSIEWFFRDSVQGHLNKLEEFTANLYRHLNQRNQSIVLTVKGTASPLAETRYNLILSERRIASLLNFWRSWNNGALAAYLDKGRLEVRFIPSGEDTKSKVSDQLSDQARSVYSLGAALERRIEIIRIEERKP